MRTAQECMDQPALSPHEDYSACYTYEGVGFSALSAMHADACLVVGFEWRSLADGSGGKSTVRSRCARACPLRPTAVALELDARRR